jgi:nucleotide-binding universal stress UspA family protein
MSIKTVLLALIVGDGPRPQGAVDYALSLAAEHNAHLSIVVGAIKVPVVVYSGVAEVQAIVTDENNNRSREGEALAAGIAKGAEMNGVSCSVQVLTDAIYPLFTRIAQRARLHDLSVCGRPRTEDVWSTELAETLLLSSGRPVIVVPDTFAADRASRTIVAAWDGTAVAARAIGEAMPLFERSGSVEVVTVLGDKSAVDTVPGAELAPMLAHHGVKVTLVDLPANRDVGYAISNHAQLSRAQMIVMGGYAHSRLRQMVLGGTTRTLLQTTAIPLFMAH